MKKLKIVIISVLIIALILPLNVFAQYNKSMLFLGDSITTGFGLEGNRTTIKNFANQLKNHYQVPDDKFQNLAVNGATSEDLLKLIPSIKNSIAKADDIFITIGGNDIIQLLFNTLRNALELPDASLEVIQQRIASENSEMIIKKIASNEVVERYNSVLNYYEKNLNSIFSEIKSINPNANIIIQTQYDPLSGVEMYDSLTIFTNMLIGYLNEIIVSVSNQHDVTVSHVANEFVGKGKELTNILNADIHPNQHGHDKIYEILKRTIKEIETKNSYNQTLPESKIESDTAGIIVESIETEPVVDAFIELTEENFNNDSSSIVIDNTYATYIIFIVCTAFVLCTLIVIYRRKYMIKK